MGRLRTWSGSGRSCLRETVGRAILHCKTQWFLHTLLQRSSVALGVSWCLLSASWVLPGRLLLDASRLPPECLLGVSWVPPVWSLGVSWFLLGVSWALPDASSRLQMLPEASRRLQMYIYLYLCMISFLCSSIIRKFSCHACGGSRGRIPKGRLRFDAPHEMQLGKSLPSPQEIQGWVGWEGRAPPACHIILLHLVLSYSFLYSILYYAGSLHISCSCCPACNCTCL